jgi:hypothetical protein
MGCFRDALNSKLHGPLWHEYLGQAWQALPHLCHVARHAQSPSREGPAEDHGLSDRSSRPSCDGLLRWAMSESRVSIGGSPLVLVECLPTKLVLFYCPSPFSRSPSGKDKVQGRRRHLNCGHRPEVEKPSAGDRRPERIRFVLGTKSSNDAEECDEIDIDVATAPQLTPEATHRNQSDCIGPE